MTVGKYKLDKSQEAIAKDNAECILVIAGAGSGKTLTILGKIKHIIDIGIKENEVICISFTKASSLSLKEKIRDELGLNINVYTFHKLALNILNNKYRIADSKTLNYIVDEFFNEDIKKHKLYKKILKYSEDELYHLKQLIETFIHLFKTNNYTLQDFNKIYKKVNRLFNRSKKFEKEFLILTLNIYLKYQKYLKDNNEIDFDDMLIYATKKVNESFDKKIKYIIIDEYQDTSLVRFNLIKSIIDKTNSKLLVVGDDFQSIYRFTGCDINLFLNFKKIFKKAKIMYIENTYRNSQELIDIAGSFVMKNKHQLKKNLKSNKHLKDPVEIIYYKDKLEFKKLLDSIDMNDLLVLGRNNNDINDFIDDSFKYKNYIYSYKDNKFKYMTVHKSKGLESNNVVILNMSNNILGFPSQIKEEKILKYITKYEKYPFSEERRLFYVALTRSKNKVYLFTPINNESIFIKELKEKYKVKSRII
ncbi:MAG: UvrD-helicase domain-containing protein [Bacilli bacterium]|nr:UvrD-helicase domain-containing protein [Bacilli bacterium]